MLLGLFVLIGMTWFILKHFVVDFPLQTPYQWKHKHIWGHPGGLLHSGLHVLGSLPFYAFALFFTPVFSNFSDMPYLIAKWLLVSMVVEFVVHYVCDLTKMRLNMYWKLDPKTTAGFWTLLGADQVVHYLTYVWLLWYWLKPVVATYNIEQMKLFLGQ